MMTFSKWILTQTDLTNKWKLDPASIQFIISYFYHREICDDDKMELFFWRELDLWRDKYIDYLRLETTAYDPLVNRYFEAQYIGRNVSKIDSANEGNNSGSVTDITNVSSTGNKTANSTTTESGNGFTNGSTNRTTSGHETHNNSGNDTRNTVRNDSSDETASKNTSSTTDGYNTNESTAKTANKIAPMNASNATGAGGNANGKLGNLDFKYASDYHQTDNDGSDTNHSATVGSESGTTHIQSTGTESSSGTTHENGESRSNGTEYVSSNENRGDSRNGTGTATETSADASQTQGSSTNSGAYSSLTQTATEQDSANTNRYTGREGLTPQEALDRAIKYINGNSPSILWLCHILETCFICVYDI